MLIVILPGIAFAGPVFNAFSNTWETPEAGARLQYNPIEKRFVYAPENASPQYNPYENTWDLAPKTYIQKHNPYADRWETTSKNAELVYNPLANDWSYQPMPEREGLYDTAP